MRYASVADQSPVTEPVDYLDFLKRKCQLTQPWGFEVSIDDVNPILKPHQRACVVWGVKGGRRALFEAFGLGKSVQQLEILRIILAHLGRGRALIVAPLGVRQEFIRDAFKLATGDDAAITDEQRAELKAWQKLDWSKRVMPSPVFVRRSEEVVGDGLYITNYESVRDGKLDPKLFDAVSLDEASVLRGFGGTKTFRTFMKLFDGLRYKFVATATPAPNEYIELLAYAAFLEVMDVGQAKTRFFKRDSEKADNLTLHPHKEEEFWLWLNSWALFLQLPSDLGFSDDGYALPPIEIRWHELQSDHSNAGEERDGQARLLRDSAIGLVEAAREKRDSLDVRVRKLMEIRAEDPEAHRLIWHDLEKERVAIEHAIDDVVSVYGTQDLDEREQAIIDFSDGRIRELAAKPVLAGSGCNFQRHCWWAIYLGIGFKFNDFIQSVHRVQRFLQPHTVRIDLIYTEAEREVRRTLEAKWRRHEELVRNMTAIIRKYRLNETEMAQVLTRSLGVERIEVSGEGYTMVNNDAVLEAKRMEANSVDLIVTSIPFSTQYEYTPSYHDFGHTDDNKHFWRQMDYLTPELLRVLKPGRDASIHVKDRITPGGINGFGFQTVDAFSDHCRTHFEKHGFAFLGRKTIVTDVVRENKQTRRLGWSEQCKDGSRMGAGMPEYVLMFRKPQTDRTKGYADEPVRKSKKVWRGGHAENCDARRTAFEDEPSPCTCAIGGRGRGAWENPDGYSRGRWQLDAHGFVRSSGDRLLTGEELLGLPAKQIYRLFREFSLNSVYDYEHHVRIAETLDAGGSLPPTFMLLPPQSWHPDVWTDVTRMLTLNGAQAAKGKEMHLCPLQFDIVDREIRERSMPGELVFDPFGGLMTVPYRALKLRRRAYASELSPSYFLDGCSYVKAMEQQMSMPSLFDVLEIEAEEVAV